MNETLIRLFFILDGRDFAVRYWPAVPRIGDRVMFHPKSGSFSTIVNSVSWGVATDDKGGLTCNVGVHRLEPEPAP